MATEQTTTFKISNSTIEPTMELRLLTRGLSMVEPGTLQQKWRVRLFEGGSGNLLKVYEEWRDVPKVSARAALTGERK